MISPNTLTFLQQLKENNHRDWFTEHKTLYQDAKANIDTLGKALRAEMEKVDNIEKLKIHRIYRDVRFSKDKTPYKTSLSGSMSRASKWLRGGYYFHIEPGNTFVGGGFWGPNSADLKRIRQEIAANDEPLREILKDKNFIKTFNTLEGDKVKTAPKGYAKDHPAIDLLRYKQYLLMHSFTDQEVIDSTFIDKMVEVFVAMRPFFDFMSDVLTTDANGVPIE